MKARYFFSVLFILISTGLFGQSEAELFQSKQLNDPSISKEELKAKLLKYDFAKIWTVTDNAVVYGFIGDNYQRIRIKLISVTKSANHPGEYDVYGKSMVKNNICDFKGTFHITSIRKHSKISDGLDREYQKQGIVGEYMILGNYLLSENNDHQLHSGIFNGSFRSDFYLKKNGEIHYDDINHVSDSFTNNQFAGFWTSHNKKLNKRCNWGDYRIPNSGNLDSGAGEFSPVDKYLPFGWQTVRDIVVNSPASAKAKQDENRIWWK